MAKKEDADRNVEAAQKNLESAQAELANVSQESEAKVAAAQAKFANALGVMNAASAEEAKATMAVKAATDYIKIADVKINTRDKLGQR